ncbi:methyltransferase domain-containing protein [Brevibacillus composti]|uniref:Methyltransferase domain-containing protein n=1 Tax=Brevibacillus composti TaxID=2796470 RepID=A0A7T5EMU1_9BACL|nr:methyltransferase domain-containing protein [Brevibacillus composti]QQE75484.1 methyltransferase domain-containing protein [Brevibacillus composti]QUO42510.1 methyltransferase domain-containing protein [Brevibacillus composti]
METTSHRESRLEPMLVPVTDGLVFAAKFFSSPRSVGSIVPSSRQLVKTMMAAVEWEHATAVAELGAGTGVCTEAIQEAKRVDCQALILEQDDTMRMRLARRYPELRYGQDACRLTAEMAANGMGQLDAVISGLPFANFTQQLRDDILDQVAAALKPGGVFVQFQYSLQLKKQLERRFASVQIRFVPFNFPCAFVYVCRKRG